MVAVTAMKTAKPDKLELILGNLQQRGHAKPRTLKTLTSTVASLFPNKLTTVELMALIQQLQSTGKITVSDNKVTYEL